MILTTLAILLSPVKDTDRVLVVQNADSPISVAVASDYMKRRHVSNFVSIHCLDSAISRPNETVKFKVYQEALELPVRAFLAKHPAIDFIVLTMGISFRYTDVPGRELGHTSHQSIHFWQRRFMRSI